MSRNLLHKSHLPAFKQWLEGQGHAWRDTTAAYQVIQVKVKTRPEWFGVYERDNAKEHYSVDSRIDWLVWNFIEETKNDTAHPTRLSSERPLPGDPDDCGGSPW